MIERLRSGGYGRLALKGAVVCLLGYLLVAHAIADRFATSRPELALRFDSGSAEAHIQIADRRLALDPPDLAGAEAASIAALKADPLSTKALTRLAQIADAKGDSAKAAKLMAAAAARSARTLYAQAWLLDRDSLTGDFEAFVDRADVVFRAHPQIVGVVAKTLAPMLGTETVVQRLVTKLAENPPWRRGLLQSLVAQGADVDDLSSLYDALSSTDAPPEPSEIRPWLARLVGEGRFEAAYIAWINTIPSERLANAGLLYNAGFDYDISNMPFDWTLSPVNGASVAIEKGVKEGAPRELAVDFFGGRVPFRNVSHLLTLPPGRYVLQGEERADGLRNSRGMRWRLSCVDGAKQELASTNLLNGDVPWRPFSVEFETPADCGVQSLVLELAARTALESVVSGGVRYRRLQISRQE